MPNINYGHLTLYSTVLLTALNMMTHSKNHLILPSLLAANTMCLGHEIDAVIKAGADGIHLDIMDHHYVPNLSFGPSVAQDIRHQFKHLLLDVHLMVSPVEKAIESFAKAGASRISFHPDACKDPEASLKYIRSQGIKSGIALNPDTPFQVMHELVPYLDFVLIMSVNPGFGNQAFIPEVLSKIEALHQAYPNLPISIDGGVSLKNLKALASVGVTQFVMGSAIFNTKDYSKTLVLMRNELLK